MEMTEDRQAAKAANRSSVPSRDLAIAIARLAADDKCTDVLVLDTRGLNPVSDYVIIASGTSDRQMRATCQHLEELGEELGHPPYRSSKDQRAVWLLVDFVDVIFHVFEPNTRAHYDLEMMWGDAPRVLWERPEGSRPPALETSGTMADRTAAAAQERDANERAEVDQAGGLTSVSPAESSDAGVEGAAAPSKRATPKKAAKKKAGTKKASKGTAKKAGTKPAKKAPAKKAPAKKASPKKAGSAKQATKQSASKSASKSAGKSAGKSASKSGTTSGSTAKAKKPATHRGAAEKSAAKGAAAKRSAGKSVGKSGGTATSKATKKTIKKKPAKR